MHSQEGNQNGESIENGDSNVSKEDTNNQPISADNGQTDIKSNGKVIFHQLMNRGLLESIVVY